MDVSPETQTRLVVARQAIEDLNKAASQKADSGALEPAIETLERNVSGASKKFLAATKPEKLKRGAPGPRKKRSKDPKLESGWVTLRFRITMDQRQVIMAAMERAREIAQVNNKMWKGVALEYVAADFLASHGFPQAIPQATDPTGPEA